MRTQRRDGSAILDVVEQLDTTSDKKPEWHYFSLQDVEKMADLAPYFEYKVLVFFLFDSGIRAPKELMNVRAMDLTLIPGSNHYYLNIRSCLT